MLQSKTSLTIEQFLAQPETDLNYELIDGQAVAKMSPKLFHSLIQLTLVNLLKQWHQNQGIAIQEWAITLKRHGKDWVPVPDVIYISYNRLGQNWLQDQACPTAPELAIEIISPGQSFGNLAEKAVDYLKADVLRVWVVDIHARTITVFYPDSVPETLRGKAILTDTLFEGLQLTPQQIFQQAGLPESEQETQ
ncbi:MAG: Uma2 family endonuclease [Symploca sp. SIO2E9]|nr:Uma2 family endonuclease [Symploca sp. SIO2E9]